MRDLVTKHKTSPTRPDFNTTGFQNGLMALFTSGIWQYAPFNAAIKDKFKWQLYSIFIV